MADQPTNHDELIDSLIAIADSIEGISNKHINKLDKRTAIDLMLHHCSIVMSLLDRVSISPSVFYSMQILRAFFEVEEEQVLYGKLVTDNQRMKNVYDKAVSNIRSAVDMLINKGSDNPIEEENCNEVPEDSTVIVEEVEWPNNYSERVH